MSDTVVAYEDPALQSLLDAPPPPTVPPKADMPSPDDTPAYVRVWPGGRSTTSSARVGAGAVLDGRYRLESLLSHGAHGVVYCARDVVDDAPRAVQVLHARAGSPAAIEALRRDGIAGLRVAHENVARVDAFGVLDTGVVYVVTERMEGGTFGGELSCVRPSLARIAQVLVPVCNALAHAHARGLVHGDVSPSTIALHRAPHGEVVKLIDFGTAAVVQRVTGDDVVGRPTPYTAPEVLWRDPFDGSADMFATGVVLYEALCGRPPFVGNAPDRARAILTDDPVRPSRLRPGLSHAVDELVIDLLRKTPSRRPTASEAALRLRAALA